MFKRHHRRLWLLTYLLALATAALIITPMHANPEPVSAQNPSPTPDASWVTVPSIRVRSGPGTEYPPIGGRGFGDQLTPVARNPDSTWVMIVFGYGGYGWVNRDLVSWNINVDELPISTQTFPTTSRSQGEPIAQPTATPEGSWVNPSGYWRVNLRAGPGIGFPRIGWLPAGATVEPLSRNDTADWVLIHYQDGYAWINRTLVQWDIDILSLPIIPDHSLTPTEAFTTAPTTTSPTPSRTATRPALLPTLTPTRTINPFDLLASETPTSSPTPTQTPQPTDTNTPIPTPTATKTPSATATNTAFPTDTPTSSPTYTRTPTNTPTETATPTPTVTSSDTPSPSLTNTSPADAIAILASDTPTNTPTDTPSPTPEPSPIPTYTSTPTFTFTTTSTSTVTPVIPLPISPTPTQGILSTLWGDDENGIRIIAGTGLSALLIGYIIAVLRGWRDAKAYKNGFIRADCPVCGGELVLEERPYSFLGIRKARRTVRCRRCRSILRQVKRRRWRYAVDVVHNRELYRRYNNLIISEKDLIALPSAPPPPAQPPWDIPIEHPTEGTEIGQGLEIEDMSIRREMSTSEPTPRPGPELDEAQIRLESPDGEASITSDKAIEKPDQPVPDTSEESQKSSLTEPIQEPSQPDGEVMPGVEPDEEPRLIEDEDLNLDEL